MRISACLQIIPVAIYPLHTIRAVVRLLQGAAGAAHLLDLDIVRHVTRVTNATLQIPGRSETCQRNASA